MNNIHIIDIDSTHIALAPIIAESQNRRNNERQTVRQIATRLIGIDNIVIDHTSDGAPYIDTITSYISISHSLHLASFAIDQHHNIGIDIEEDRSKQIKHVAPRVLSEQELAYYSSQKYGLLKAWTLKEALCKASGKLNADFRHDIILPTSEDSNKALVVLSEDHTQGFEIILSKWIEIDSHQAWLSVVRQNQSFEP